MNYGYEINGAIEQLDYTVHLTMGDHEECIRFFAEHPVFGTVGYASYEDAEDDLHGFLGIGQFLDTCESMVNAGYDGDHFYFDRQEMLVKVRCDYWGWTWTPETGIVYDPQSKPVYPKNKSRRAVRIDRNKQHKGSDRAHGKKRMPSAKFVREADSQNIYHAHAKFVWHENHKGEWIPRTVRKHDKFRQERFMRSAEITEVERLTASVLAHMSNHVFMWDEQVVWDLTEALCEEYRQVFPDDSYICVYGKHVYLYMQYMDGSVIGDERRYTLR